MRRCNFKWALHFFSLFLFYLPTSLYGETLWFQGTTNDNDLAVVTYAEGGRHFVDYYTVPKNGEWQDRLEQKVFLTESEARVHVQSIEKRNFIKIEEPSMPRRFSDHEFTNEVIWSTREAWSMEWERAYGDWIQSAVHNAFFSYYRIAIDCADVVVALRWIFSRIHGLPVGNTFAGSKRLFTNESMRQIWRGLPTDEDWYKDQRFLTVLNYVLENTYTHSLRADSYPVAIHPDVFTAGVHHLNLYDDQSGHSMMVSEINRVMGGIFLLYSTVPRAVRDLWVDYYQQASRYSGSRNGGFLKIRWPEKHGVEWRLRPSQEMPGFSLEQYDEKFAEKYDSYSDAIEARLGVPMSPVEKFRQNLRMLNERFLARLKVVEDGYYFCRQNDCAKGSLNYENWSTPSRDEKIVQLISLLKLKSEDGVDQSQAWREYLSQQTLTIEKKTYKMSTIVRAFERGLYSSDPRDPILRRWGR